jgi:hypothetical protein
MQTQRKRIGRGLAAAVLATAGWAGLATHAQAGPIEPRHVAEDARWYVHLDMAKMVAAPLGQAVRDQWMQRAEAQRELAQVRMITGMDPWKDLRGVTLYGPSGDEAEAVAVIYADADSKLIENNVAMTQDYNVMNHGGRRIHMWTPEDGNHDTMALCVINPTTYVLGVSPERVKAAVDAIDRNADGAQQAALIEKTPDDRWMEMAVLDVHTMPKPRQENPWVQQNLRQLRASVGSNAADTMMTLSVVLADEATAQRSRAMLDGFKAMAEMRVGDLDPNLLPLLQQLNVQQEGARLWLDCAVPTDTLLDLMRRRQEQSDL